MDGAGPYALGQFLHERFDQARMLAFHNAYGRPGYSWPKGDLPNGTTYDALTPREWKISIRRSGAADIATLSAADTLGLAKGIDIVFTFPRHQPYMEVGWRVTDKSPNPLPEGGWLCFPLAVSEPRFLLGRLGGPIDPARDIVPGANRHYFCLNTGITVAGRNGGIGLCPLDSPCVSLDEPGLWKFSLDYVPRKSAVFVNLYNNEWNTNFPEWQGGTWCSRVRLWPLGRRFDTSEGLIVPSWEARLPLLASRAQGAGGLLSSTQTGLSLSRRGVLVTAFGQNPDGPGTLLRVWEQGGKGGRIKVTLPDGLRFSTAAPVNLRGEHLGGLLPIRSRELTFDLPAFAPASFLLQP